MPIESACENSNISLKTKCLSGYYMVEMASALNSGQRKFLLKTPSQAAGLGMSISLIQKTPSDIELLNSNELWKYVYDGWAQQEIISNPKLQIESVCSFSSEFNEFCEFGIGRAAFYINSWELDNTLTVNAKKGREFELVTGSSYALSDLHFMSPKTALALRTGDSNKLECFVSKDRHNAECY